MGNSVDSCCANRASPTSAYPLKVPPPRIVRSVQKHTKKKVVDGRLQSSRITRVDDADELGNYSYFTTSERRRRRACDAEEKEEEGGEEDAVATFAQIFKSAPSQPEQSKSNTRTARSALGGIMPPESSESDDEANEQGFSPALTAQGSIMKADACFRQKLYVQSKMHLKRAIAYALDGRDNDHNALTLARAYGNLACVLEFLGKSSKAVAYHIASINILRKLGDKRRESVALQNARVTFIKTERYQQALVLAKRSLVLAGDDEQKAECEVWCETLRKRLNEN